MVATEKRVLVVDDEPIVCESYRLALTDAGYDVRTVASGRDAIQACRSERFDMILADLKMPDVDGLEVARVVAKEFPGVRMVIITGYPSHESARKAEELGVMDYLEKPLSPERLSEATAAALSRPWTGVKVAAPAVADVAPTPTRQPEGAEPDKLPQGAGKKPTGHAARQAVSISMGFLAGVMLAYFLAPVPVLAYLAVGTAIASGTLLGIFSEAFFAKGAGSENQGRQEASSTSPCEE